VNPAKPPGNAALSSTGPHPERKNTVNKGLTPERARHHVENDDYGKFARRVVNGYARRIATGDIEALTQMITLADDIEAAIRTAVIGLREHGYSWAEIGSRLGVTRQAAQQRWGHTTPGGS
jgi:hypothetical protein